MKKRKGAWAIESNKEYKRGFNEPLHSGWERVTESFDYKYDAEAYCNKLRRQGDVAGVFGKRGDWFVGIKMNSAGNNREGAWATEFMEKYNQMGISNFIDPRDRIIDGVQVNLSDYEKDDKVIKIWTLLSRYQGKGKGSEVLEKLKALADETKTSIVLKPGKWGIVSTLSVPQLKEWYMRHGFKEMKNGWLIYKPKGVTVKVNLESHLGAGFWGKKAKRKSSSKPRAGRIK